MEPVAIPEVKAALGRITLEEAEQTAQDALHQGTAREVQQLLETRFEARIHDLLTGDSE